MGTAVSKIKGLISRIGRAFKLAVTELKNPDVWKRAFKTFWQAALATITLPASGAFNLALWKALAIAAAAAGAAAAYNGVVKPFVIQIIASSKVPVPGTKPGATAQGTGV